MLIRHTSETVDSILADLDDTAGMMFDSENFPGVTHQLWTTQEFIRELWAEIKELRLAVDAGAHIPPLSKGSQAVKSSKKVTREEALAAAEGTEDYPALLVLEGLEQTKQAMLQQEQEYVDQLGLVYYSGNCKALGVEDALCHNCGSPMEERVALRCDPSQPFESAYVETITCSHCLHHNVVNTDDLGKRA